MVAKAGEKDPNTAPKKRRRSPGTGTTSRKKKTATSAPAATNQPTVAPTHTLIIDNGGDTLKYGWVTDDTPRLLPNVTARLAHQITLLVGDELSRVQNPNSLIAVTRNMERGLISNMGNQAQVWKRLLDLLGVSIPLHTEAAQALGWKVNSARAQKTAAGAGLPAKTIPSHTIAVVLLVPPHCPRLLLDQMAYVWLEDFGVGHVGFANSTTCASVEHKAYRTACTVDLGWSSGLIVPTFRQKLISPPAIRRLPFGGRHLINIMKYYMSYRQYNLMDQEFLVRDVLEKLGFISMTFREDLKISRYKPSGLRPYDRDYVLPDYQTTHQGQIRLTRALQKSMEEKAKQAAKGEEDDEEDEDEEDDDFEDDDDEGDDSDDNSTDNIETKKRTKNSKEDMDSDEEEDDEEEETLEQKKQRLLRERAEEARRRREEAEEEQILRVSVERFTIPEIIFRPSDAGMPSDVLGLAAAIVDSIAACPAHFQPALYESIYLVGGLSQLPNLKERLQEELRALAPFDFKVDITTSKRPTVEAWIGAKKLISETSHTSWSINREEWQRSGKRKAYGRLLEVNGGPCV